MELKYPITMDYVDSLSGRGFEIFTKNLLNVLGYSNVKVTPSTNDHGLDVLYMNNQKQLVGIQDKHYDPSTQIGYDAIEETDTGADYYNADECVILTNCHFGKNALESAHTGKLNIQCWDRNILKELIDICNNILFSRLSRYRHKNKFNYKVWTKSKTQYFTFYNISGSSMLLLNLIFQSLKAYKHKILYFKYKKLSKIFPKKVGQNVTSLDKLKLYRSFNELEHECLFHNHNGFSLYSNIDIDDSKRAVIIKLSNSFYKDIYEYILSN